MDAYLLMQQDQVPSQQGAVPDGAPPSALSPASAAVPPDSPPYIGSLTAAVPPSASAAAGTTVGTSPAHPRGPGRRLSAGSNAPSGGGGGGLVSASPPGVAYASFSAANTLHPSVILPPRTGALLATASSPAPPASSPPPPPAASPFGAAPPAARGGHAHNSSSCGTSNASTAGAASASAGGTGSPAGAGAVPLRAAHMRTGSLSSSRVGSRLWEAAAAPFPLMLMPGGGGGARVGSYAMGVTATAAIASAYDGETAHGESTPALPAGSYGEEEGVAVGTGAEGTLDGEECSEGALGAEVARLLHVAHDQTKRFRGACVIVA